METLKILNNLRKWSRYERSFAPSWMRNRQIFRNECNVIKKKNVDVDYSIGKATLGVFHPPQIQFNALSNPQQVQRL